MTILVIGNGFDLAHGLKTSYEVFYTSYNYLEYDKSYLFSEEVESLIIQKNVY